MPYKSLKCLIRPYKALSRLNNKPYKSLYGLIFGAILSTLGNLEPFWNHFGTVFRLSLRHLQVSVFRGRRLWERVAVRAIFLKVEPSLDQLFGVIFDNFWCHFLPTFWSLFGPLLGTILGPNLGPDRPKRGQDEPKRTIRSFKEPKSCIFKNLKKPPIFEGFWVQRPPKRASRDPRRLPRGTQRAPKPPTKRSKIEPKN